MGLAKEESRVICGGVLKMRGAGWGGIPRLDFTNIAETEDSPLYNLHIYTE